MTKIQKLLRELPKVDEVLLNEQLFLCKDVARPVIVDMVRDIIAKAREEILSGEREEKLSIEEVVEVTLAKVKKVKKKLRRIINATGVILHTNLGRSVLSTKAQEAIIEVASSYSNLEYNLDLGARGSRHDIVEHIVKKITNSQACMVVNNNAAATMLVLASMAKGREVIISRGELVEIGGSFRIPDVMQESGGILKEVGATNKTRLDDYKKAFDEEKTAAILKVHTSNYRIVGFTQEAELKELVDAAKSKPTLSEKERRELGTFRYALKLSMLEASQKELQVRQKLLEQIQPLTSDQPFVDFKKQSLTQELRAIELQLTPNFKLSEDDKALKERLKSQFEDSVALPVSKATAGAIQLPIRQLRAELGLVDQIQDDNILTLLKGTPTRKHAYTEELQTHISIFQLKYQINNRNHQISRLSDEVAIKEMRVANAKGFSELKRLYKKLQSTDDSQSQIAQTVSKQLQERKVIKKAQMQQSQGPVKLNTDFMRQLSSSLNRSQLANKKALMERARSDEREEQRRQAQR
mgnify:CR=1 FL=1